MTDLRFASVSVNRSDWGRMLPLYDSLDASGACELCLYIDGDRDGEEERFDSWRSPLSDKLSPSEKAGALLSELGRFLAEKEPDYLIILGDRYEMLAAAQAALLASVPIIHIGGGYLTLGAFDEQVRHALTKLSSLHFAASEDCAARIIQMGEEPSSVHQVGAPDIDALHRVDVMCRDEFFEDVRLDPSEDLLLVTLHPETHLDEAGQRAAYNAFFLALERSGAAVLATSPCPDPGAELIVEQIEALVKGSKRVVYVPHLGQRRYVSAMKYALAMVGNSSSGLIEAAAVPVPVVNVGNRQDGRTLAPNVISVPFDPDRLQAAIAEAVSDGFQQRLVGIESPYGDGQSIPRMEEILLALPKAPATRKQFREILLK